MYFQHWNLRLVKKKKSEFSVAGILCFLTNPLNNTSVITCVGFSSMVTSTDCQMYTKCHWLNVACRLQIERNTCPCIVVFSQKTSTSVTENRLEEVHAKLTQNWHFTSLFTQRENYSALKITHEVHLCQRGTAVVYLAEQNLQKRC